jgi:hypothetical protein
MAATKSRRSLKNITITLDAETAAWARVRAAQRNVSLSRFVGGILHERMREAGEYERAMRQWLAEKPVKLKGPAERYPTRDELYDRGRLR